MRTEVANVVHRILHAGLDLKARLDRGESPDLEKEQAVLRGLLNDDVARRYPEYTGDSVSDQSLPGRSLTHLGRGSEDPFLGMRYALVCWLDEIFLEDLSREWDREWNERKLEHEFYRTTSRAFQFWHQARKAETKSGDPLEVYYLCVMLGFRGDLRDDPDRLQNWVSAARAQIARSSTITFPKVEETEAPTYVPPFNGRAQLQRMVLIAGAMLLLLILLGSVFVMFKLQS
jgi:type VI secretion system protein ImpK